MVSQRKVVLDDSLKALKHQRSNVVRLKIELRKGVTVLVERSDYHSTHTDLTIKKFFCRPVKAAQCLLFGTFPTYPIKGYLVFLLPAEWALDQKCNGPQHNDHGPFQLPAFVKHSG